ncbi:protein phosphatase inhibitor 2 isoform X2 [Pan troglodytes]|uniref:protein phosphatase inhibitor 2 isoform X2 n=1 Tax=Pan troglodytes TaxID=9598 RepID=UPI0023F456F2|nr:protein phosphatase inhibitor 2 isoform X2 [Pan troglodytes]
MLKRGLYSYFSPKLQVYTLKIFKKKKRYKIWLCCPVQWLLTGTVIAHYSLQLPTQVILPPPPPSMMGDDEDACSDTETTEAMAPDILARKLAAAEGLEPKYRIQEQESSGEEDSDLSPEEREKKRQFEMKRKLHYNEGLNIKLARQLISKDLHDDDEDEEMLETADGESMNTEESNQGSTPSDQQQNKLRSS